MWSLGRTFFATSLQMPRLAHSSSMAMAYAFSHLALVQSVFLPSIISDPQSKQEMIMFMPLCPSITNQYQVAND